VKDFAPTGNQTPVGQLMMTKFLYLLMYHRVPNAVFWSYCIAYYLAVRKAEIPMLSRDSDPLQVLFKQTTSRSVNSSRLEPSLSWTLKKTRNIGRDILLHINTALPRVLMNRSHKILLYTKHWQIPIQEKQVFMSKSLRSYSTWSAILSSEQK